jgi:hypothetical protein
LVKGSPFSIVSAHVQILGEIDVSKGAFVKDWDGLLKIYEGPKQVLGPPIRRESRQAAFEKTS